jgi:hypothetical protein
LQEAGARYLRDHGEEFTRGDYRGLPLQEFLSSSEEMGSCRRKQLPW